MALSLFALVFGQVLQAIKYQVVVRNNNGIPLVNKAVSLKIGMLEDNINGAAVYIETHSTSTNAFGLINVSIGTGDSVLSDFDSLMWNLHEYFVKVEVDTSGGTNFVVLGTSQLLTVPYAFYSNHSKSSDIPLMTTAERDAIQNPWPGMQILNSDDNCINIYNGNKWIELCDFHCGGLLVDSRDQQEYPTIKIGTQCWMAKN